MSFTEQEYYDQTYNEFDLEEKKELYKLFSDKNTRIEIKDNLEKILFYITPPTPEEFLNPDFGFLPESYLKDLYPHVKNDFIQAMNNDNPYSIICMYGSTRTGKSVLARLFILYTIIWVNYLRDPHLYYHISQMSRLCIYLVSFKDDKTRQVYLDPLLNLLDASGKFCRERFELNVYKKGVDNDGVVHFAEASKFGNITFPKLSIVTGRDASSLIGADIISGAVSELTFFKEYVPGLTDEEVLQVFTKLSTRIKSTVGYGAFPCWTYLDSSANDAQSPLEKIILKELKYDKTVYFKHYVLWEVRPHLFPKWQETNETFDVCVGDGTIPAKIISNSLELATIPKHLLIQVPIDLKDDFEKSLIDKIKDIAGRPTSSENKFIQDFNLIKNLFSNNILTNIEGVVIADAKDDPKELIWKQIYNRFFIKYNDKDYVIKRSPTEPRYIGIDMAESIHGGIMGFSMIHKELSRVLNKVIFVTDFSFPIKGFDKGINLESPTYLIMDLILKGHIYVRGVYSDTFQSSTMLQFLQRNLINSYKQSVDRALDPYQFFMTCLVLETIKSGKNVFLKNNLDNLYRVKKKNGGEKIDHYEGSTNNNYIGDYENSDCGKNAKDVSDSLCQALWGANSDDYYPCVIYEDENKKYSEDPVDVETMINSAYNKLHKFY